MAWTSSIAREVGRGSIQDLFGTYRSQGTLMDRIWEMKQRRESVWPLGMSFEHVVDSCDLCSDGNGRRRNALIGERKNQDFCFGHIKGKMPVDFQVETLNGYWIGMPVAQEEGRLSVS